MRFLVIFALSESVSTWSLVREGTSLARAVTLPQNMETLLVSDPSLATNEVAVHEVSIPKWFRVTALFFRSRSTYRKV